MRDTLSGAGLLFLALACGCTLSYKRMTTARIEVDLYSGRPNPVWDLSHSDAQQLAHRLQGLPALPQGLGSPAKVSSGLGYRGLRVEIDPDGTACHLAITSGYVIYESGPEKEKPPRQDTQRSLEKWLLKTGKATLGDDLLKYLLTQVGGPATGG